MFALKSKDKDDKENWTLIHIITYFINIIYFGLGVAMFVIGVLYLTVYFYEYSFSAFNPTLVAAFFVPFGIVIAFLAVVNIFCLQLKNFLKHTCPNITLTISSSFILILFIVLLGIGVWGLTVYTDNKSLVNEVRSSLIYAGRHTNYFEKADKHKKELDWLHQKFACCGVDSYLGMYFD